MTTDERLALQERGIGLTKTHVYITEAENEGDPDVLIVSMADYFEGETFDIVVLNLDADMNEGDPITGTAGTESAGKISGSTTKICGKDTTYPLPFNRMARVKITYLTVEQVIDITPNAKNGWIEWTAL